MSHIVSIQTEVRDPVAIQAACQRLQLSAATQGTFKLFSTLATGWGVQLQGWRYPVVCNTDSGQLSYDNFGGRWGEQQHLDRFVQMYSVEKARLEARRQGHTCTEQQLQDGSIKLTIHTEGGV